MYSVRSNLFAAALLGVAGSVSVFGGCSKSNFAGNSSQQATNTGTGTGGSPGSAGSPGSPGAAGSPGSPSSPGSPGGTPGSTGTDVAGFPPGKVNPAWAATTGNLCPGCGSKSGWSGTPGATTDTADGAPIRFFDDGFPGVFIVKPLTPQQNNFLWAVTATGTVTYMQLTNGAVTSQKQWTGAVDPGFAPAGGGANLPCGGSRTYVLEGGSIVIARTGGYLFWIDPASTPQGDLRTYGPPNYYKLAGPVTCQDRVCPTSYRKADKRYIGMGYGKGSFVEFAQDNTPPYAPQWGTQIATGSAGTSQWGYSCTIDQDKLIYYSQWTLGGQPPAAAGDAAPFADGHTLGIDLTTMQAVDPKTTTPNGSFASQTLTKETMGPKTVAGQASYAMGGDRSGDVLNGTGYYTMAYEPVTNTIWGSGLGTNTISIFPADCLTKTPTCTGYASFNTQQLGFVVGPLSAVGDGHMIGMVRSVGTIMMMSLKNPADITQGINAVPVATVSGDPYMYTDFTGATLYLTKSEQTFDLTGGNFDATKPNKGVGFAWAAKTGAATTWTDILFEVRCYKGTTPGAYETFSPIADALQQTIVTAPSCTNKTYDHVDIRLTQQNNGSTLMNVRKIQLTAFQ